MGKCCSGLMHWNNGTSSHQSSHVACSSQAPAPTHAEIRSSQLPTSNTSPPVSISQGEPHSESQHVSGADGPSLPPSHRFIWEELGKNPADRKRFCEHLKNLGFAIIAAPRPARRAIGAVQNVTRRFFDSSEEDRSALAKIRYARGKLVGYLKREDGAQFLEVHATTVEGMVVPEPKSLPMFGPAASRLHAELLQFGRDVLSWFAEYIQVPDEALLQCIDRPGLEGLEEDDCGACVLRLCNYALCETEVVFGEHTDASFLTVAPRSSAPGLQMWHRPTARWLDIEDDMESGDIVVFVGDFVEVLTKGTFRAALHRVVLKPCDASHRLSMPFLMRGQPGSMIDTAQFVDSNVNAPLMRVEKMSYEELRLFLDLKGRKRMKSKAEAEEAGDAAAASEMDELLAPSGKGGRSVGDQHDEKM